MKKNSAYIIFFILFYFPAHADTIFFKNGTRLDIASAWEEGEHIQCALYGEVVSYHKKDILRIEKAIKEEKRNSPGPPEKVFATSDELIKYYTGALKNNPGDSIAKKNLDMLTLHAQALELAGQGLYYDAIAVEKQALKLAPDEAAVRTSLSSLYNAYGVELKNKHRPDEALDNFANALEYSPHQAQVNKNIAVTYIDMAQEAFSKNDTVGCERYLEKASGFDSQNPFAYLLSGKLAYHSNNYDRALNDWAKALELDPGLPEVKELLERLKKEKALEEGFETKERFIFSIKFEGSQNRELADSVLDILRDAYREIGRDFYFYPDAAVPVIIYSQSNLKQLDYFPDWAAGTYDGKIRFGEDLWKKNLHMKAVLYHEYTHVLVRMLGGNSVPFWLNEGLAEYEARQFKTQGMINERIKLLAKTKNFFSLSDLTAAVPAKLNGISPGVIELMYAQSESFAAFLIERYSLNSMKELLVHLGKGKSIEKALEDAVYGDLKALDESWKNQFKKE